MDGEKRAWYPLFVHVLNFPEIWENLKLLIVLYLYNRDAIMYILTVHCLRFSNQQWKCFDRSFSCALELPPTARYF